MSLYFPIQPIGRFHGPGQSVKRPKEFTSFSFDDQHHYRPDRSSLSYYYPPQHLPVDLCRGFDEFVQLHYVDEHLVGLLKAIQAFEQVEGKKIDAHVVTWRGMMTKIMALPFADTDSFEMNATLYQGCIFIEEHYPHKVASQVRPQRRAGSGPSSEMMTFWGYKFETISTLPSPWGETTRDYIQGREQKVVNNNTQYCSVVRTGIDKTILCLGGEVDALWDSLPLEQGAPVNWVELKTTQEIRGERDREIFHSKLLKYWIQSFLLGVPKIVVGFRDRAGLLLHLDEIETQSIPDMVARQQPPPWNPDICINLASAFLDWLRQSITGDGVWRIRKRSRHHLVEIFKAEEAGHGQILTDDFINWRIQLSLRDS